MILWGDVLEELVLGVGAHFVCKDICFILGCSSDDDNSNIIEYQMDSNVNPL